jgi:CubicO group peptidase (beta-lactamase class C family)
MNRVALIILTLAFGFFIPKSYSQVNPNPSAIVDALITAEMTTMHLPGVATMIVKDDKVVWNRSYGFADIENANPVSKEFPPTCTSIRQKK